MVTFYLLYIFSGVIKSILSFYHISLPIDFTLLTAIFLVLALFVNLAVKGFRTEIKKSYLYAIGILLLFYTWILVSLLYTPSHKYAYIKAFYFLTNVIAFIFPLLLKNFDYKNFVRYFIITTLLFSLFFLKNYSAILAAYYRNESTSIGLYLVLSTLLGIGLVLILTSKEVVFENKYIDYSIAFFSLIIIILLGARGPLIFAIGLLIIYFFAKFPKFLQKKIKIKFIFGILMASFVIVIATAIIYFTNKKAIDPFIQRSIERLEIMLNSKVSDAQNSSIAIRIDQLHFSLKTIFKDAESFFIGQGFGSFKLLYEGIDGRAYPHNIFLEVWFELGFIGEFIFLSFFVILLFRKQRNFFISHWVLLFIILNMAKSNSLIDIRTYFAFFALFLLPQNIEKQEIKTE